MNKNFGTAVRRSDESMALAATEALHHSSYQRVSHGTIGTVECARTKNNNQIVCHEVMSS